MSLLRGDAHDLPVRDRTIDLLWSRDMLTCVEPVRFFSECGRALRPGGSLVLHATYFTDQMEPSERGRLAEALALSDACDRRIAEEAMSLAGLEVERRLELGAEWCEGDLVQGSTRLTEDHLTVMRLRRGEDELVEAFGREWYETILASHQWMILIALGKLEVVLYLLRSS